MNGRVLIVEDEPLVRRLLVKVLEPQGVDVEEAGDGAEALALIFSGRFHVVLLDLVLPRISGYEILQRCAASLLPPRPLFVVTTGFGAGFRQPLDAEVVTAVLEKPLDLELLGEIVREMARAWEAGQAESAHAVLRAQAPEPPALESTV